MTLQKIENQKMKFRGTESFYIRNGWLSKGLSKIIENPTFFTSKEIDSAVELGVGSNMAKSIRYYLNATGLATEERGKGFTLTKFGENVIKNDKYLQMTGTLLLLHFNLATNIQNATSWYFFFNEYDATEINKKNYLEQLKDFIKQNSDTQIAERSLEDDFSCILKTYLLNDDKDKSLEDNLDCPLSELNLLRRVKNIEGVIAKKCAFDIKQFPHEILLYLLAKANSENANEIKISKLESAKNSIGKVFNLSSIDVADLLDSLSDKGFIKVVRTAGIETVQFTNINLTNPNIYIEEYYTNREKYAE